MSTSETIKILEVLEDSKLGKKMNDQQKVIYLIPIAFELTRIMEKESSDNQIFKERS